MRFGVLGPLEVRDDRGELLEIGRPKQRTLLGILLLNANRPLSTGRLIEGLWGERLPGTPNGNLKTHVWALRRLLGSGDTSRLRSWPGGYQLDVAPQELDLLCFQQLAAEGRDAVARGQLRDGARALQRALALWRGAPLDDVTVGAELQTELGRLEEERAAVVEAAIDARLELGEHAELVGELGAMVAAHPLRERLCGQLMVALGRSGRRSDALAAFRALRERLAGELGVEPGPALQQLQRQLLTGDPALLAARPQPAIPVPRQLPPGVTSFVGRTRELARIHDLVGRGQGHGAVLVAIDGTGGVGKSALAVHAAHQLQDRFPDGQLYVNLQGATAGLRPLAPLEVLRRWLTVLGVEPDAIPRELPEAVGAFRTHVAGQRVLLLLDDALDAAQVAPLLPGGPGCAVLVTSRPLLASLDSACHLHLDVLAEPEAATLLGHVAGADRAAAEPQATAEVARWCGHLPLALRIAGARLAARPGWPLGTLAERLADARCRLDELQHGQVGVRASFSVSYRELDGSPDPMDQAAARAFCLLGIVDSPDVSLAIAARLLDEPEQHAERAMERLVDACLLTSPAPGRYRFHDLLRLYARELATSRHPEPERVAALTRAVQLLVATAWQAFRCLRPDSRRLAHADPRWARDGLGLDDRTAALAWFTSEHATLVAAARQAAAIPATAGMAAQLAHGLYGYFMTYSNWADAVEVNKAAAAAAAAAGDRAALAHARTDLGIAHRRAGHHQQALDCLRESLRLYRELGDRRDQAGCTGDLAASYLALGQHHQALDCLRESLRLYRELDDRPGQACVLNNLGIVLERLDQCRPALASLQQSLALFQRLGSRRGQANSLNTLGRIHHRMGNDQQALACQRDSLRLFRELEEPYGEAESLRDLGTALHARGRDEEARIHWEQALDLFEQLRTQEAAEVRALLAGSP